MSEETLIKRLVRAEPVRRRDDPDHIRHLRRVVADAGDTVLGVRLGLSDVSEHALDLKDLADFIATDGLIQGYEFDGRTSAIWTFGRTCIRACVEAQTLGRINANPVAERDEISAIDAALTNALAEAILPALDTSSTPAIEVGQVFETPEEAILALHTPYFKVFELTLDFDRGALIGKLQAIVAEHVRSLPNGLAGGRKRETFLGDVIGGASAVLEAELYRTDLSFDALRDLKVGSVIPMPRDALSKLRLRGATGKTVAYGRLGQLNGRKAIRLSLDPVRLSSPKSAPKSSPNTRELPDDAKVPTPVPDAELADGPDPAAAPEGDGPTMVPMAVLGADQAEGDADKP